MAVTKPAQWRFLVAALAWCVASAAPAAGEAGGATVFEGARLITGDGGAAIEDAAFVVAGGEFIAVGRRGEVAIPPGATRVDLAGRTVMPALIDDHVHMGYRKGTSFSAVNYTAENLRDQLDRFAFFGVAAVLETGTGRGELPYEMRDAARAGTRSLTAGRGFAMPGAGPGGPMAEAAYGVTTVDEARADVRELAARKPDMVKIWVDDRDGTVEKLRPDLYRAIIDEAHRHHLKVMAHMVDLADAKDLLRAGVDGFAHMIRDRDVDDELLALLRERPDVFFLNTLWGERRAIYTAPPAWLDEPLLREAFTAEDLKQLAGQLTPDPAADPRKLARARAMEETNFRNTARLVAVGVRLGLGTDTGGNNGGQFFGLGSHVELELLVRWVGLTPMQAITIGTRDAAAILGLDRLGTVAPGKSADFIVLDANPLDDIANTRRIAAVYLRGAEIPRAALSARWIARD
ncbi:MAG: amidohydrolase family protein [Xanthobacteraceae bacterium]|nr:amidohydrolase family protein [Xanthobacteraceae bacterium]